VVALAPTHIPAGSAAPAGTGVHVPAVAARAHERQAPVQAVRQQTPCAQTPLAQARPSSHAAPGGLRPHEPFTQKAPAAQSPSAMHVALHASAPHVKGAHDAGAGVTQVPAPSQDALAVKVVVPAGQLASAQGVPWA
jgi:hypothetical protein